MAVKGPARMILRPARGRGNQGDWADRKIPKLPDTQKNRGLRAEQDRHNAAVDAAKKRKKEA